MRKLRHGRVSRQTQWDPSHEFDSASSVALVSHFASGMPPSTLLLSALPAIDKIAVLAWFSGMARSRAEVALRDLAEAIRQGYWQPRAARRVRAWLNKQTVAKKFALAHDHASERGRLLPVPSEGTRRLADITTPSDGQYSGHGWQIVHAMMFGIVDSAPDLSGGLDALAAATRTDAEASCVAEARRWLQAFAPVAQAMTALDALRPQPNYVVAELPQRTVDNLSRVVGVACTSATVPAIVWRRVEHMIDGTLCLGWEGEIQWPAGTRHGASRFAGDAAHCEACGASIRNPHNFFPLLLDGERGPASLWVGRDCARRLVGAKVKGEGTLVRS